MSDESKDTVSKEIAKKYLSQESFGCVFFSVISDKYNVCRSDLRDMVSDNLIDVVFERDHPNIFVKNLPARPSLEQVRIIDNLSDEELTDVAVFPSRKILLQVVNKEHYKNRPFSCMLATGGSQLDMLFFNPHILKRYRDDPRYSYDFLSDSGNFTINDSGESDLSMPEKNKVFMKSFGVAYDNDYDVNHRTGIVALLYDLHKLSPEHQLIWNNDLLPGDSYTPRWAFVASQILGSWDYRANLYEAFMYELKIINKMSLLMEGEMLFKNDTTSPPNFHRILIATRHEYQEFVESLDKLMSDNINKKFFSGRLKNSIPDYKDKGTITLLEEYFKFINAKDRSPLEDIVKVFRRVRSIRSKSSHHDIKNEFNYTFNLEQDEIMNCAYTAVRTIRLAFANHTSVSGNVEVPDWLYRGDIDPI